MLYLAFIYHMHQPYYNNLLTGETDFPWVRLHGSKDYLDMVEILKDFPLIHQTFNLVPSLIEQIEQYAQGKVKDKFLEMSLKPAAELNKENIAFLLNNFFKINPDKVISTHPRYYELYFKNKNKKEFTAEDLLDLQVWFNLSWIDPSFRESIPELKQLVFKGRFFNEEDKRVVLNKQLEILSRIIPTYRKFAESGQIEITFTPFYHPILPLLYNTNIAKEANRRTLLPARNFSFPHDAFEQIKEAAILAKDKFGSLCNGMWPSEESVCEHIIKYFIQNEIKWIVADEAILYKSLKKKTRDTRLLYQPFVLKREEGELNIVFRDRNLSDLIGFIYHNWDAQDAASDFMKHLENIANAFKDQDILLVMAMDGENAWEYFKNDGHDFLKTLYKKISDAKFIKTTAISEYLKINPPKKEIKRLSAGSWIYGNFDKWINHPYKARAWEWLSIARSELQELLDNNTLDEAKKQLAIKQMHIAEGSDWFWWYGEDPDGDFDRLFKMHLGNFYDIIGKKTPDYLVR